jgi:uncharacterized protein YcbK (DUF882 family)
MRVSRRISRGIVVAALLAVAMVGLIALTAVVGVRAQGRDAGAQVGQGQDRFLVLNNLHTGERLRIVFRRGDEYVPGSLAKLDYFLRDHETGEVRHFDPRLYDILADLTAAVGRPGGEIEIVCGYRAPSTNAALRARTMGVAKNSLHIQAEAIDLRMAGVDTLKLRMAALGLRRGGVGYYPHSDFIHVDTGRVRQWCFDCPASLSTGD